MWIFLNNSFLSIVADRDNTDNLLVRARIKGDIDRVFPEIKAIHSPKADYAYRASIPRNEVSKAIEKYINSINYDNFKDSVQEHDRHDAYFDVWSVMRSASDNDNYRF